MVGRRIKVIADEYVDREFGTGALKITPGEQQGCCVLPPLLLPCCVLRAAAAAAAVPEPGTSQALLFLVLSLTCRPSMLGAGASTPTVLALIPEYPILNLKCRLWTRCAAFGGSGASVTPGLLLCRPVRVQSRECQGQVAHALPCAPCVRVCVQATTPTTMRLASVSTWRPSTS